MRLFDGLRANKAASRAYPLLDLAITTYGDPNGIVQGLKRDFAGVVQGFQRCVDEAASEPVRSIKLDGKQRNDFADVYRGVILREAMAYLLQWQATVRRNSMILDALCIALTGVLPLEFEPLQRLIQADQRYPGIDPAARKIWQFGKDLSMIVHNDVSLGFTETMALSMYYRPISDVTLKVLDAYLHLSAGPEGDSPAPA